MEDINNNQTDPDNIIDLLKILWSNKFPLLFITVLLTALLVGYILFLPNYYTSSSLLKVSYPDKSEASSGLSRYAGIASLAGVSLPSASEDKGQVAIETIKSRSFLKHLISFDGVLEKLVATKAYDHNREKIIYDETIYNDNLRKWVKSKPSYLEAYDHYEDYMNISLNKATGFISLSYEHISPQFSFEFTNLIIRELNILSREIDIKESSDSLLYLEGLLEDTKQTSIKISINQMIESQLRTKMLSNIRDDYLLSPIDPPFIPELKSSPARAVLSIMSLMLSFFMSILIVLAKELIFYKKG
tara:strand:+ start:101 stop:1006 length:906 start_codon:yes stop_codon:yes gene_type:complete